MTTFPSGLSRLKLFPNFVIDDAHANGGFTWQTEDEDPYWLGEGATGRLNHDRLQDWEGFVAEAIGKTMWFEFLDPICWIPGAYRSAGVLPGGWSGLAALANLDDAWAPKISGLYAGLELRRGDRIGFDQGSGAYKSYHIVTKPVESCSASNQVVELSPPVLPNVISTGAQAVLLNPVARMHFVVGSWSAPRVAREETIGSFSLKEATAQS